MIELPFLNGEYLGDPLSGKAASLYVGAVEKMLFATGYLDFRERYSRRVILVGFLLYSNAHVEFLRFLHEETTWSFLDAVSGRYFHVFSIKLEPKQSVLDESQQKAMTQMFEAFGLGSSPIEPHLVLAGFKVGHEIDSQDQVYYRGELHRFAAFQLGSEEGRNYLNILRRALYPVGRALEGMPLKPVKTATRAIQRAQLGNLLRLVLRDFFKSEMAKKLVGAWRILNWRPKLVDGE